jgi:hypothetical protein
LAPTRNGHRRFTEAKVGFVRRLNAVVDFGTSALKLGQAVAGSAFTMWLNRRKAKAERGRNLIEIAAGEFALPLQEAKLRHLVDGVANQVAEQLEPLLSREFSNLPQHEIDVAMEAARETLERLDVRDDETFMSTNADPEELARLIRKRAVDPTSTLGLSQPATDLYNLALDQACRYLSRVLTQLPAFQGRALAETLVRLAAQTKDLTELLARTPRSSLDAPRGTQHDKEFERVYVGYLQTTLDKLELLGLSMRNRPQLSLSVAYLSLTTSHSAARTKNRFNRQDARHSSKSAWFGTSDNPDSDGRIEATIGKSRRTLLRGEAGSGKTTLLNWIAVSCALARFSGAMSTWNGLVPFPVRLRSFAEADLPRPEEFVSHAAPSLGGIMPEGWTHRILRDGRGLMLIDGVDEIPRRKRSVVKAWLNELLTSFPEMRIIVTARPAAADSDWLEAESFASIDLEQMSPSDIRSFLRRWHDAAALSPVLPCDLAEIPRAESRLMAQLDNRHHLRSLATNPLLCAMLCALNLTSAAELPQSRMELYRAALDMLLDLRDAERQIPSLLSTVDKVVLLRDLAWRLTQNNRVELSRDDVREFIERKLLSMPNVEVDVADVVDHLLERSGVIREPVPGRVNFVHRTFQEYLAASEATEQRHLGVLIEHAHLDQWRETIVMACGHAKRPQLEELLSCILDRAELEPRNARRLRVLAAACLETTPDVPEGVRQRIDRCIGQYLVPPRSVSEAKSLSPIGHRLLRHLPESLDGLSEPSAAATTRAATMTGDVTALQRLTNYSTDARPKVQAELLNGWQYFDPERYAKEVLADAPLLPPDGYARISLFRLTPYLRHLRNLHSVELTVMNQMELDSVGEVPHLKALMIHGDCTLSGIPRGLEISTLSAFSIGPVERSDLDALVHLPALSELLISHHELRSIRGLEALSSLTSLSLYGPVEDLSPLISLAQLSKLSVSEEGTVDLSVLARLPALYDLALTDATWFRSTHELLTSCPNLTRLMIDRSNCASLAGTGSSILEWLSISDCPVSSLEPLRTADALEILYIDGCPATDVSPLAGKQIQLWVSPKRKYLGTELLDRRSRVRVWR